MADAKDEINEYDDKLEELKNSLGLDSEFDLYVYALNGGSKELMKKYYSVSAESIPDQDAIGKELGSGRYMYHIHYVDPTTGKKRIRPLPAFSVGATYAKVTPVHQNESIALIEKLLDKPTSNNSDNMFMLMMQQQQKSMEMMVTMFTGMLSAISQKPDPMASFMPLISTVIGKRLEGENEMLKISSESFKKGLELSSGMNDSEETDPQMEIIGKIIDNAPLLLSGFVDAMTARKQLAESKDFAQIANNDARMKTLISGIIERHGVEKAKALVEKAGLSDRAASLGYTFQETKTIPKNLTPIPGL